MSRWNHSICEDCWDKRNPGREPVRVRLEKLEDMNAINEVCCFCGDKHSSDIYVREDPAGLVCKGEHAE
jgi:hypothetical protein